MDPNISHVKLFVFFLCPRYEYSNVCYKFSFSYRFVKKITGIKHIVPLYINLKLQNSEGIIYLPALHYFVASHSYILAKCKVTHVKLDYLRPICYMSKISLIFAMNAPNMYKWCGAFRLLKAHRTWYILDVPRIYFIDFCATSLH